MSKYKTTDISSMFNQELKEMGGVSPSEVEQLQQEIERLRMQLEEYQNSNLDPIAAKLAIERGTFEIPIEQMRPYIGQPRQTITQTSITKIKNALESEGQYTPVILIRVADDDYLIFDGERRWRGALELHWSSLKAVFIESPDDLFREIFLVNQYREELNALDKAQSLVQIISHVTQIESKEIPKAIMRAVRRLKRYQQASQLTQLISLSTQEQCPVLESLKLREEERLIFKELLALQLNPVNVEKHLLPMLSLSHDLVEAIRTQELGCAQAKVLSSLSSSMLNISEQQACQVRQQASRQVLEQRLSVAKTRDFVKEIKKSHKTDSDYSKNETHPSFEPTELMGVFEAIRELTDKKLIKTERSRLEELHSLLQQKLTQIDKLLK